MHTYRVLTCCIPVPVHHHNSGRCSRETGCTSGGLHECVKLVVKIDDVDVRYSRMPTQEHFACLNILHESGWCFAFYLAKYEKFKIQKLKAAIHVDYVHRMLPCAQKLITNYYVLIASSLFLWRGAAAAGSLELTNPLIFQQLPSFSCRLHDKGIFGYYLY